MSPVNSSVLAIGLSQTTPISFGVDFTDDHKQAKGKLRDIVYPVILLSMNELETMELLQFLESLRSETQVILIGSARSTEDLKKITNSARVFKIIHHVEDPDLEFTLKEALEEYELLKQNKALLLMLQTQNDELEALEKRLKNIVEERKTSLKKSHSHLQVATQKLENLLKHLVDIHSAVSVEQLEKYAKEQSSTDFSEIKEALLLANSRLEAQAHAQEIRNQWEATFNSLTIPVALISEEYEVLRGNTAFAAKDSSNVIGKKCYSVMFKRTEPCEGCKMGQSFRISNFDHNQKKISNFDVSGNLFQKEQKQNVYVHFYRDITEQMMLERKSLEAAKTAELGVISGSIAHDLNNPLAGIITFLQLIKMDMNGSEAYYQDVVEMEKSALKCKTIIETLLDFSRKPNQEQKQLINFTEVINKAIHIMELQSKSIGIKIEITSEVQNPMVLANSNILTQSFVTLIQVLIQHITENLKREFNAPRHIRFFLHKTKTHYILDVIADASYLAHFSEPTSGLATAVKIWEEHGGRLDFSSETTTNSMAKISLPRPELDV